MLAPNGTPEAVISAASQALRTAQGKPEVRDTLAARGSPVRPMAPAELTAFIRAQQEQWKPAIDRIPAQPN